MRWVVEAVIALSSSPDGFTASALAGQVRALSKQSESEYGPRRAAYDLKKLRGKKIVRRIGRTRRYESVPKGLRAMAALVVLRNQAIKPLLAAAQKLPSLLSDVLKKNLAEQASSEAAAAAKISQLLNVAVAQTRSLARGLYRGQRMTMADPAARTVMDPQPRPDHRRHRQVVGDALPQQLDGRITVEASRVVKTAAQSGISRP